MPPEAELTAETRIAMLSPLAIRNIENVID
jgi:hypothetical protein